MSPHTENMPDRLRPSRSALLIWLLIVCATIFSMIVVGGITRLTDSGLSMVEWKPLMGILPPSSMNEWRIAFEAYQQYPQYAKLNQDMNIEAFKSIFYWEYGHRLLGRLIGVIYFVPLVLFLLMGRLEKGMPVKLCIGLMLGGLQGLLGWYMVKSGLIDVPRVSHYRLAAHLGLALLILAYLSWLIMEQLNLVRVETSKGFKRLVYFSTLLLLLQIFYGALVAGNRAGYGYNTFPLMNGEFVPQLAIHLSPYWLNFLDNNAMLQFVHRWLGFSMLLSVLAIVLQGFKQGSMQIRRGSLVLLAVVSVQFLLGVFTLLQVVPIGLASMHQAGAGILLLAILYLNYIIRPLKSVEV